MIHTGDCLDVMAAMDPESVDAFVTDPPYGIGFMGREWDDLAAGHQWAAAALRVAKPGAYLLAFGGTRTVHRLACAIEDAGWIIRDTLVWGYAQGFPKSRASLKPAWEPIVMARKPGPLRELAIDECRIGTTKDVPASPSRPETHGYGQWAGGSPDSSGFDPGLGRWPANIVLTDPIFDGGWDGVVGGGEAPSTGNGKAPAPARAGWQGDSLAFGPSGQGPLYGDTGTYSRFFLIPKASRRDREPDAAVAAAMGLEERAATAPYNGGDGMPGRSLRDGEWQNTATPRLSRVNTHPTVKPVALMRHLVRLVTPKGGTVLDPFLGSGTTALAAEAEGYAWIGIEREPEYVAIAQARLAQLQIGLGL